MCEGAQLGRLCVDVMWIVVFRNDSAVEPLPEEHAVVDGTRWRRALHQDIDWELAKLSNAVDT